MTAIMLLSSFIKTRLTSCHKKAKTSFRNLVFLITIFALNELSAHPFSAGQIRLAAGGGGGVGGWSVGLAGGYFVVDSLEIGIGSTYIDTEDVSLVQLTGKTTYVFLPESDYNPYAGVFTRRWLVTSGDARDQSSVGGRLGIYKTGSSSLILGLGVVHEVLLDCNSACKSTYPEFSLSLVL